MLEPTEVDGTSSPALRFGAELRRLRRARGWSQGKLGERLKCSNGLVSYIERGKKTVTHNFAVKSDEVFETGMVFQELWRLINESSFLEGFDEFEAAESRCLQLRAYEMDVVLGILMTEDYLRALEQANVRRGRITQSQADDRVARTLRRQELLNRVPMAEVHAVLDESCLCRPIGGTEVMDAQLAHLEDLMERPNVTLQVAPFELAEARPFARPVVLLDMPNKVTLGYSESLARGYVERDRRALADWRRDYDRLQVESLSIAASRSKIRAVRRNLK
ncbi:DUF5753 domain-containing protein [Kitasatospora cineracea]|uniref:DUF5753 domain-containing protein n=1 Tax=Kitasatospora cineracea TaxID=88074 RepID=UPI003829AD2D